VRDKDIVAASDCRGIKCFWNALWHQVSTFWPLVWMYHLKCSGN